MTTTPDRTRHLALDHHRNDHRDQARGQGRVAVSVAELQRAWQAVQDGYFRATSASPAGQRAAAATPPSEGSSFTGALGDLRGEPRDERRSVTSGAGHAAPTPPSSSSAWEPAVGERVVVVIGCHGSAGASVLALALASTAVTPARVVECTGATASGLAGASTAELGVDPSGWVQGSRGSVLIERAATPHPHLAAVPTPTPAPWSSGMTVLDVGWELGQVLGADSWLTHQVLTARSTVVVARATVPGLRRLDSSLALLHDAAGSSATSPALTGTSGHLRGAVEPTEARTLAAAIVGPRRGGRSPASRHRISAQVHALARAGRWVDVVEDRRLALRGLDSTPLSRPLLACAAALHACLDCPGDTPAAPPPPAPSSTTGSARTPHDSPLDLLDDLMKGQNL